MTCRPAALALAALVVVTLLVARGASAEETPAVAAASDLQFALTEVAEVFRKETGAEVRLTFGSSGNFFRQIQAGAPFQVYFSADEKYVIDLAASGHAEDEGTIVTRAHPDADEAWVGGVVDVVRRTRAHADLLVGSSVRGALDTTAVAWALAQLRGASLATVGLDAALVALSGRVRVREGSGRRTEDIITELWQAVFQEPEASRSTDQRSDDQGKAPAPAGRATT